MAIIYKKQEVKCTTVSNKVEESKFGSICFYGTREEDFCLETGALTEEVNVFKHYYFESEEEKETQLAKAEAMRSKIETYLKGGDGRFVGFIKRERVEVEDEISED